MLENGSSANEISRVTGLSNKQLFYRLSLLKLKGYNFEKKYYYNGDIVYNLLKKLNENNKESNTCTILTSPKDSIFKAIFISDIHIGNEHERIDLLNRVYDFCIKEGINIIINGGDFIDGLLGSRNKKIQGEKQIDYALKVHPFDKNILNFIILGNHDKSLLDCKGINIAEVFESRRHDLVPIGYKYGILKIKNDEIFIYHKIPEISVNVDYKCRLKLYGHSHEMKFINTRDTSLIYLPSLISLPSLGTKNVPAVVKAEFSFINGFFKLGNFETFIFGPKNMYKINEVQCELYKGRNINSSESIMNEEERNPIKYTSEISEERQKILKNNNKLTQIEKFNKRYNIK